MSSLLTFNITFSCFYPMARQLPSHNLHYHEGCIASDAPDLLLEAFLYVHKSWQGDYHSETPL